MDVAGSLQKLGYRVDKIGITQAVRNFQNGYNLGQWLTVDGVAGPLTQAAIQHALDAGGKISAHFGSQEFACKCGGQYAGCGGVWTDRRLLQALEALRAKYYPNGLTIISGCRCVRYNAATDGAASQSQHLFGRAVDIPPHVTLATMEGARLFSGIGWNKTGSLVSHVDVRPNATVSVPATWEYDR